MKEIASILMNQLVTYSSCFMILALLKFLPIESRKSCKKEQENRNIEDQMTKIKDIKLESTEIGRAVEIKERNRV